MGRGKQKTSANGKHRKETKEERRLRLKAQEESREKCFNALPYVGGVILVCLILFGLWVRSVPPKAPKPKVSATAQQRDLLHDPPDFMFEDTTPKVKKVESVKVEEEETIDIDNMDEKNAEAEKTAPEEL